MDFLRLIPDQVYKYIGMGVVFLAIFRKKIPIVSKIDVRVRLPEEFMRNFRWITPLLGFVSIGIMLIIYFKINIILGLLHGN